MAQAAGLTVAAGAITAANEVLFAPLAGDSKIQFNWRIIPATAVLAVLMSGLDKVSPKLATGIAATALITVVFTRIGRANAPAENIAKALGY